MTPVRVVYDISVLGSSFYNQSHRTGIARVIENLALELVREASVELSFCAVHSLKHLVQVMKILPGYSGLDGVPLCHGKESCCHRLVAALTRFYPLPEEAATHRLRYRTLNTLLGRCRKQCMLPADCLNQGDILHLTYHPLPSLSETGRQCKRFLTVYDLIPLIHPEFFEANNRGHFKQVLNSITADDWVITISEATKADLCNHTTIDPARVFVAYPAASGGFFRCTDPEREAAVRARYKIPEGPYVLSLCTLEPRKNTDHVLRSFIRLVRENPLPDLSLVLAGTRGWGFDRIFEEIEGAAEFKSRIIVTGFVDDLDLPALYSGAMMFVYPSFYEGFGLPPLEAMQCGIPVVTSNTSSLPEVVGDAGIMIDPVDEAGLCHAMYRLYREEDLRQDLSTRAIERARQFSWKRCARETLVAYETALGT